MTGAEVIPFVIGVTGHRDPEPGQLPLLRAKFERILSWVHERAPDTPILLLSGLAAGCDQLAARWALEWSRSRGPLAGGMARIRLGCLLPLERAEYLKDFAGDPEALAGFMELESQAAFVVCVSSVAGHAESKSDGCDRGQSPAGQSRDDCYERLGRFLADRSQLLVAFWNRVDNQKRGGTAHVVMTARRIAREGADRLAIPGRGERHVLASHDVAVIEVIDTVRKSPVAEGEVVPPWESLPEQPPSRCRPSLESTDPRAKARSPGELVAGYLAELNMINGVLSRIEARDPVADESPLSLVARPVSRRFAVIDAMAVRMKKIFAFNVLGLTAITVLAVGFFQWFGTHDRQYWAAWTYLSLMVVAFGWYLLLRFGTQLGVLARRASVAQVQWLFVHGRAISEALRVQVAWSASGLPDFVTDHYMARRSGDMAFLRQLIRAASIELVAASAASVRPTESAASVGLRWFEGQVKYMKRKTGAERSGEPPHRGIRARAGRVLRGLMRWWWLLILLLSLGLAWVSSRHPPASHVGGAGTAGSPQSHTEAHVASPHGGLDHAWLPFGVFVVGSLLFLKVGIEYHDDAVLAEEDSETYERLLPVFERALTRLAGCDDDAQCQRIIRAVGKESLDEQAEWFVRHLNSLRLPNVG